jgi:hypothetical protein
VKAAEKVSLAERVLAAGSASSAGSWSTAGKVQAAGKFLGGVTGEAGNAMRANSVRQRRGVATLDYVLLMGIVLPLVGFILWVAPRMMNRVYEFTTALTGVPF